MTKRKAIADMDSCPNLNPACCFIFSSLSFFLPGLQLCLSESGTAGRKEMGKLNWGKFVHLFRYDSVIAHFFDTTTFKVG